MYKIIKFKDHPGFKPNLTPDQIFKLGSFGGTYRRPIYSSITGKKYKNEHKEFKWSKNINNELLTIPMDKYNKNINKYKVKVGTSLEFWENSGWITKYDPYGWVQWYSRFYDGRRIPEEDERQIKRWQRIAGINGRFRIRLFNIKKKGKDSPRIKQTLIHWALYRK